MEEYAVDITDVVSYVGPEAFAKKDRCVKQGQLLARSKNHFVLIGIKEQSGSSIEFAAACLTSTLGERPHDLKVLKTVENDGSCQLVCHCSCKAAIDRCKHIVAFLLKLSKSLLSDIPILSKTETEKQWGKLSEKRIQTQEPCRSSELCHVRYTARKYKELPSQLSPDLNSFIFNELIEGFPQSILAAVTKVNSSQEGEHQQDEQEQVHNSNSSIDKPDDVVQQALYDTLFLQNDPPFSDEIFFLLHSCDQHLINYYYENVAVTRTEAEIICTETKNQNNYRWRTERKKRITGSTVYSLYTYASNRNPDWKYKINNLLLCSFRGNEHTRFGKNREKIAKQIFRRDSNSSLIDPVGLVIKVDKPWLAFSPDGFAQCADDENNIILLEIKALKPGKECSGLELCKRLSFLTVENDVVTMKERSAYYGQIQLGLAICNLQMAQLLLYADCDQTITTVDVPINLQFVDDMIQSVTATYFTRYLPELYENKDIL